MPSDKAIDSVRDDSSRQLVGCVQRSRHWPGGSLVGNRGLVTKVYFPRILLPLAGAAVPIVDFLLALTVLVGMMVWFQVWPSAALLLAPLFMLMAFATALGDDPYSDGILALASAEGVNTDLILKVPARLPGLYLIETNPVGERTFYYWRENSPARELFELPDWNRVAETLVGAKLIYFSGVTLSLYSNEALGRFLAIVEVARKQGTKVAFDGNFRPRGWKGDLTRTRTVFMEALKRVDIALPTYDDEAVLWGDPSPEATVERMRAFGIGEVAVKNGPNSALVFASNAAEHVPVPEVITTARTDVDLVVTEHGVADLRGRSDGERARLLVEIAHPDHRVALQRWGVTDG